MDLCCRGVHIVPDSWVLLEERDGSTSPIESEVDGSTKDGDSMRDDESTICASKVDESIHEDEGTLCSVTYTSPLELQEACTDLLLHRHDDALPIRLNASNDVEIKCDSKDGVWGDAGHRFYSSANTTFDIVGMQVDTESSRTVQPGHIQVDVKTETSYIKWSGKTSEVGAFMNQLGTTTARKRQKQTNGARGLEENPEGLYKIPQDGILGSSTEEDLQSGRALLVAIDKRRDTSARLMVQHGANLNTGDHQGRSPLLAAIDAGFSTLASLTVNRGANLNAVDHKGRLPLLTAIDAGFSTLASLMVNNGANLNAVDHKGRLPLLTAIDAGFSTLARLMVNHGANPNAVDQHGRHPLLTAIDAGFSTLASLMVNHGANLNVVDQHGRHPLSAAIDAGFNTLAKLMVQRGADLTRKDHRGRVDAGVESLVETKVSPFTKVSSSGSDRITMNEVLLPGTNVSTPGGSTQIIVSTMLLLKLATSPQARARFSLLEMRIALIAS